jgi:hypothetical protein
VNAYTVTITCEGYNAQMVVKIEDASGTPRISELCVRPTEGNSLSAAELPSVNLDFLLRSLQQPGPTPGPAGGPNGGSGGFGFSATGTGPAATASDLTSENGAAENLAAENLADPSLADPNLADPNLADPNLADPSLAGQDRADKATSATAVDQSWARRDTGKRAKRVGGTAKDGAKNGASSDGAVATQQASGPAERGRRRIRTNATVSGARAYRRMPDDLAETYAQSGSVTAVAKHYGVPRHTAQGWVDRLRRQG